MSNRAIVLDANIVIRAVLGVRVRRSLENYADAVTFFVPESALSEAREHLVTLFEKRGGDPSKALRLLDAVVGLVDLISPDIYGEHATEAKRRIGSRDPDDWPVVACALAFGCPIWTEDADFFGCGIATWTSNNVEFFLGD
jgi:predicted nucleic acid-binding protein